MAFKKKSSEESTNTLTGFLPENQMRTVFHPLFATSQPIETDEENIQIKGTALIIFQGTKHSTIDWVDNGEAKSAAKLAFVVAVRGTDGSFKNIGKKTSYSWIPGNDLDKIIRKLGGEPVLETVSQTDNELFGDDFGTITRLDLARTWESLESLRGKAYTAVMERKLSKKGAIYYDIDIASITARLGKDGNHIQAQKASDTNPDALVIDWED